MGATAIVADALARAVAQARPDVIVHQLTALSGSLDLRHPRRDPLPRAGRHRRRLHRWHRPALRRLDGPGRSMSGGGEHARMIRERKFPVVGNGARVWSFVHIEDAAAVMTTEVRGASNAKAKRELGWTPAHPTWRQASA